MSQSRPRYVFPARKRWPIYDQAHAIRAAEYLLAGRGKPGDWPAVWKTVNRWWGKVPEVRKLLDRYLAEGPPPGKRAATNPAAALKKIRRGPKANPAAPKAKPKAPKPCACQNPPVMAKRPKIREGGRLVDPPGKWEPVSGAPLILVQHPDQGWVLAHRPSGLGLVAYPTKGEAREHLRRARTKKLLALGQWTTWDKASKAQREAAMRFQRA